MTFAEAMRVWHDHSGENDGYYLATDEKNDRRAAVLAVMVKTKKNRITDMFWLYKPNSGRQAKTETLKSIKSKYRKVSTVVAQYSISILYENTKQSLFVF